MQSFLALNAWNIRVHETQRINQKVFFNAEQILTGTRVLKRLTQAVLSGFLW